MSYRLTLYLYVNVPRAALAVNQVCVRSGANSYTFSYVFIFAVYFVFKVGFRLCSFVHKKL